MHKAKGETIFIKLLAIKKNTNVPYIILCFIQHKMELFIYQ